MAIAMCRSCGVWESRCRLVAVWGSLVCDNRGVWRMVYGEWCIAVYGTCIMGG